MVDNNDFGASATPDGWGEQTPTPGVPPNEVPPAVPPHAAPVPPPAVPPTAVPPAVSPPTVSVPPPLTPPAGAIPTPPSATPVVDSGYGQPEIPIAPPVEKAPSKAPWILAVGAALLLLVGGGVFAVSALGASGGGDSPEDAMEQMLAAIENEDFITLAEMLEPGERRTVAEPLITDVLPELVRLGVLDDSADAGAVGGVDIDFTDVTFRTEPLVGNPDISHVFFTGGEVGAAFNEAEFPFGDAIRDRFGDDLEDQPRETESVESEDPIVFVERDGRWYFSFWFTSAENARLAAGGRLPLATEAPPALGSETPEAAVEAMFAELVEYDLGGLIGRLDPEETAAIYRYSPLFLNDAQGNLDELEADLLARGITWGITDLDFDTTTDGDDAIVTIRGLTLTVESPEVDVRIEYGREAIRADVEAGEVGSGSFELTPRSIDIEGQIDGESFSGEASLDPEANELRGSGNVSGESFSAEITLDANGQCSRYSVTGPGVNESGCLEEEIGQESDLFTSQLIDSIDDLGDEFPGFPVATRRTDGEWFVSPTNTLFNGAVSALQSYEEEDFEALLDGVDDLEDIASDGADSIVDSIVGSPGVVGTSPGAVTLPGAVEGFEPLIEDFEPGFEIEPDFTDEVFLGTSTFASGPIDPIEGTLLEGTFDTLEYEADGGDQLVISLEAANGSDLDSFLRVFTPDGQVLENDDAFDEQGLGGSLDSRVTVTPANPGFYFIEIRSFQNLSSGDYTLTIEGAATDALEAPAVEDRATPLVDDEPGTVDILTGSVEPISGTLDVGGFNIVSYTAVDASSEIVITLEGDDGAQIDPFLRVTGPDGQLLLNDDADVPLPDAFDSQVVFSPGSAGTYLIEVRSFSDSSGGDYTLTIEAR